MKVLFVASLSIIASCSSLLKSDYKFKVRMLGSYVLPSSHDGSADYDSEPQQAKFTIQQVNLLRANSDAISLYTSTPKELTIVDRAQIIYEKSIDDDLRLDDTGAVENFSGIQVVLDTNWTCVTTEGAVSLALSTNTIEFNESFTIGKAQDKTFTINVNWKDIVKSDGLDCQSPELEIVSTATYD